MIPNNRILLLELGGTISSITPDPASEFYSAPTQSISETIKNFNLHNIEIINKSLFLKISHHLTPDDLLLFANTLQSSLEDDDFAGIVVTCGTNAIEDIAYFTGLVIKTEKPIVFTGAQYPQNSLCFDGALNLYNAICVASSEHARKLGVLVCFNGAVVSARDAYKSTPDYIDNFNSDCRVGDVIGGNFKLKSIPSYRHTYLSEFDLKRITHFSKTCILYAHVGMDEFLVNAAVNAGISGIISAGFGKGYQNQNITDALYNAVLSGIIVVRCPRVGTSYSGVDKNYDDKYSFIVSKGLSAHKCSLLLSIANLFTKDRQELLRIFEEY